MIFTKTFDVNDPILYVIVAIIICFVLAQSFVFLFKALKRAKEKEMDQKMIKKIIIKAAIFTIAPALSILVGIITLSVTLGLPAPWLRLSVAGSITYELSAAGIALGKLGLDTSKTITDASTYVTVIFVMTLGVFAGIISPALFTKKIQSGLINFKQKDPKWGNIFSDSLFIGMISAFFGYVFCDVGTIVEGSTKGLIPVCVMFVSALVMAVLGTAAKKTNKRWLYDYALPISLVLGMASAIPFTMWLG